MSFRKTAARTAAAAAMLIGAAVGAAQGRDRPQTTPLADPQLFISPCGKPYRSKAGDPYPVVAWFRELDANKDGHVDRAEFRAEAQAFFATLDRNGDGVIDDAEIDAYERNVAPEVMANAQTSRLDGADAGRPRLILAQMSGAHGSIDPGGGDSSSSSSDKMRENDLPFQGAAAYGLLGDAEPVRSAERTFNGRISLPDMLARADHNFDALDAAGRGYLLLEELPRTAAQDAATPARRRA